jgi:hypothetical protein
MGRRVSATARVSVLALAWTAALALLAYEWTQTPLSGPGPAFVIWSLPALPLAVLSWAWLRRLDLGRLRLVPALAVLVALGWALVAILTTTEVGAEWELDGIILRNAPQRVAGIALWWLPGVWGALLSVAALAAVLEARYRLAHPAAAPDQPPPTPSGL